MNDYKSSSVANMLLTTGSEGNQSGGGRSREKLRSNFRATRMVLSLFSSCAILKYRCNSLFTIGEFIFRLLFLFLCLVS
jgi:hypothetical protein